MADDDDTSIGVPVQQIGLDPQEFQQEYTSSLVFCGMWFAAVARSVSEGSQPKRRRCVLATVILCSTEV